MGHVEVRIAIAAKPDTATTPPTRLQEAVWEVLSSYAARFAADGIGEAARHADAESIVFTWPGTAETMAHQARLAIAGELASLDSLADEAGYALISPRESVREALGSGCDCAMCGMLRPDPAFEAAMIGQLGNDQPDVVRSAAWYLRQAGSPSRAAVEAVFDAGGSCPPEAWPALRRAIETMVTRTTTDLSAMLRNRLSGGRAGTRALVVAATCALARIRPDFAATVEEELLDCLGEDDLTVSVAAEQAGYLLRGATRSRALAALLAILDRSTPEETRHDAILSVVNLHLPPQPPTRDVWSRLEREAMRSTPAGELAAWALQRLPPPESP